LIFVKINSTVILNIVYYSKTLFGAGY